jgi:hypothetical protein
MRLEDGRERLKPQTAIIAIFSVAVAGCTTTPVVDPLLDGTSLRPAQAFEPGQRCRIWLPGQIAPPGGLQPGWDHRADSTWMSQRADCRELQSLMASGGVLLPEPQPREDKSDSLDFGEPRQ